MIEEYYRTSYKKHVKWVSYQTKSSIDAEDIVQEAFTRAMTYLHTFKEEKSNFHTWFSRILINCIKDWRRETYNKGISMEELNEADLEPSEDTNVQQTSIKQLKASIETEKNEGHKHVLKLYFFHGMKPSEIRQVTSFSLWAVKMIVKRFKKKQF